MLAPRLFAAAVVLALGGCTSGESLESTTPQAVAQAASSASATPPSDPTPFAPATVTPEEQLAACREMQRALQAVTREHVAPYPPLSAESYALVSDAENALSRTQTRLSASDEEIMWRAGSALNQIIIGDEEPPPFALLDSIKRELAARCRG